MSPSGEDGLKALRHGGRGAEIAEGRPPGRDRLLTDGRDGRAARLGIGLEHARAPSASAAADVGRNLRRKPREPHGKDARPDRHRPLFGRPLRPADRQPARGHRQLRQVGRRLPGQHRHRHGAAGPEVGADHPGRRRADGQLHPRAARSRGRRRRRRSRRPGPPDRAGAARRAEPKASRRRSSIAPTAPTWRSTKATSTKPSSPAAARSS